MSAEGPEAAPRWQARSLPDLSRRFVSSEFTRHVAQTFATRMFGIAAVAATTIVVARTLGPDGRGLYAAAAALAALGAQFGNLGLQTSNTYFVTQDREHASALVGNTLVVSLVVLPLTALLVYIVFEVFPTIAPVHGALLGLALLAIPFTVAMLLLQNLLLGLHDIRSYNALDLGSKLGTFLLLLLLIAAAHASASLLFGASVLIAMLASLWGWWRATTPISRRPQVSMPLFRRMVAYGLRAYLGAFFAFLLLRSDLLLVQYYRGPTDTGYYSVAVNMADMLYILPAVVGALLFPRFVAMTDSEARWRWARRGAAGIGVVLAAMAVISALVAGPVVRVVFGSAYSPAVRPFVVLAVAMIFYGANNVISNYAASAGYPWFAVLVWVAGATLNILLNLVLIPRYGITGSAVASLIGYGAVMLAQSVYFSRWKGHVASPA